MFEAAKIIRIIPDRPGVGGIKTGVSTQVGINDIRDCSNVYIYNGRWRNFPLPTLDGTLTQDSVTSGHTLQARQLHVFAKYSLTDPAVAATIYVLGYDYDQTATQHRIWNYSGGQLLKYTTNSCLTAYFLNIKNRCFISMGGVNNFIYDGTTSSTNVYDVGVDAPLAAPTYTFPSSQTGTCAATNGCSTITQISGTAWTVDGVGKTIVIGGSSYGITSYIASGWSVGLATGTSGSSTVTLSHAWPADGSRNGLTMTISGYAYVVGSYEVDGATTVVQLRSNLSTSPSSTPYSLSGKQFQLSQTYQGITAWSEIYQLNTGNLSWTGQGPQYAYAYYDPVTGHVSNGSPPIQVTEQDQGNVSVRLATFAITSDTRFTKILIFRTLLNGGNMLFPLADDSGNYITVNNTGSPTFDDTYEDSHLLTSGALQMPQITNKKPPKFTHMSYWDGRVWGNPVNDPSAVWFSADSAQVPFGVPEESYPTLNVLRIAAEDGRVTGMKIFGDYLIVVTDRYSYYVTGNNETNYRLMPFPAPMHGIASHQMSQVIGQYVSDAPNISYMGNDWRMYLFNTSTGNQQISQPVQDVFDTLAIAGYSTMDGRMLQMIGLQNRWIIYAIRSTGNYATFYAYDYENNVWLKIVPLSETSNQYVPLTVKFSSGTYSTYYMAYASSNTVKVYKIGEVTGSTGTSGPYIRTSPLDFGRKSMKQLDFVRIYAAGNQESVLKTYPWSVTIVIDDGKQTVTGSMGFEPDRLRSIQPQMTSPVDSSTATELVYIPPVSLQGHRFDVKITWPTNNTYPTDCFALDVAATDIEEQTASGP